MKPKISDYANYNYQEEYWKKVDRRYENTVEQKTLQLLLRKIPKTIQNIIDIGCGFGRLFPAYSPFAKSIILFDYSQDLLNQAKASIKTKKSVQFIQGNAYEMPFPDAAVDCAVTIRTLHHFVDTAAFLQEVHRIVKPGGYFIFEVPNKRHIVQIMRYFLKKTEISPFTLEPHVLSETFLNYHPEYIHALLKRIGFTVICSTNTSFFRHPIFKKVIPYIILVWSDRLFQILFSWLNLTPSIYLLCQKKGSK